jgi:hypothetical protein
MLTEPGKNQRELFEAELKTIEQAVVEMNGKQIKPSKCFHIQLDPPHVLFNENCPQSLREKIQDLLQRYTL